MILLSNFGFRESAKRYPEIRMICRYIYTACLQINFFPHKELLHSFNFSVAISHVFFGNNFPPSFLLRPMNHPFPFLTLSPRRRRLQKRTAERKRLTSIVTPDPSCVYPVSKGEKGSVHTASQTQTEYVTHLVRFLGICL